VLIARQANLHFVLKNEWRKILKKVLSLNDLLEKAKPAPKKNLLN
jgi:hypothetical protein